MFLGKRMSRRGFRTGEDEKKQKEEGISLCEDKTDMGRRFLLTRSPVRAFFAATRASSNVE